MGTKLAARDLMLGAGVPVVRGVAPRDQSDEGLLAAIRELGYPVLIKASAGGGGKGMRVVRSDAGARFRRRDPHAAREAGLLEPAGERLEILLAHRLSDGSSSWARPVA